MDGDLPNTMNQRPRQTGIYAIDGRPLKADPETLQPGIYVIDGKKVKHE